jgi:hypothetical protein
MEGSGGWIDRPKKRKKPRQKLSHETVRFARVLVRGTLMHARRLLKRRKRAARRGDMYHLYREDLNKLRVTLDELTDEIEEVTSRQGIERVHTEAMDLILSVTTLLAR